MGNFINRRKDLELLGGLYKKRGAQFLVLYGRRRVGKTSLLEEFSRRNKILHWIAYRSTSEALLIDFSKQLYSYLNGGVVPEDGFSYGSWKVAFEAIAAFAKSNKKLGIIIDEFPYVIESDRSVSTILQAVWDSKLSHSNVFFGLSGSSIGMMKSEILESKAPLYGRATAVIHLQPIGLFEMSKFFPKYTPVQLVEVYGVTGGVPKYFEFFSDKTSVLRNVEEAIKNGTTLLTAESDLLLNEEFRETRIYLAILRALGRSALDVSEISNLSGIDPKSLAKYIDQLIGLSFLERKIPVGANPAKSRKGIYFIKDPFLNFYFRFIAPHLQDIERSRLEQVLFDINKNFDAFIGKNVFEKLCREWVADMADREKFSFVPQQKGEYWDKEMQVDVLALNHHDQAMLVGEAKWTNSKVGLETLRTLEINAKKLSAQNGYYFQLILFSRAGFTSELTVTAQKRNVMLVSLKDMF